LNSSPDIAIWFEGVQGILDVTSTSNIGDVDTIFVCRAGIHACTKGCGVDVEQISSIRVLAAVDGIRDAPSNDLCAIIGRTDWMSIWLFDGRRVTSHNSGADVRIGGQGTDGVLQIAVGAGVGNCYATSGGITFINT
jgi:hypothetical protein